MIVLYPSDTLCKNSRCKFLLLCWEIPKFCAQNAVDNTSTSCGKNPQNQETADKCTAGYHRCLQDSAGYSRIAWKTDLLCRIYLVWYLVRYCGYSVGNLTGYLAGYTLWDTVQGKKLQDTLRNKPQPFGHPHFCVASSVRQENTSRVENLHFWSTKC